MKFTLNLDCGNAAFADDPQYEIARILRKVAEDLIDGGLQNLDKLRDINGNIVGQAGITDDR